MQAEVTVKYATFIPTTPRMDAFMSLLTSAQTVFGFVHGAKFFYMWVGEGRCPNASARSTE
eukprot:306492-Amphidinium_carterae.1